VRELVGCDVRHTDLKFKPHEPKKFAGAFGAFARGYKGKAGLGWGLATSS
jgi:hypothetical protein